MTSASRICRTRTGLHGLMVLTVLLLVAGACGDEAAPAPSPVPPSAQPATTQTEQPATTRPANVPSATEASSVASTAPAHRPFSIRSHGAGAIEPLPGSDGRLGSGCTPGPDGLPDGIWFGWVTGTESLSLSFDLACLSPGMPPVVANTNPTLRTLTVDDGASVQMPDGSAIAYDRWSLSDEAVWLYVNGSMVTEVAYPTIEVVPATSSAEWRVADVAMPVTGGCCAEMYQGPASPADPWPAVGMPADGIYAVDVTFDAAAGDAVLTIRRYVACETRPEVCFSDFAEGDIGIDLGEAIVRRISLATDALTVRVRGIEPLPGAPDRAVGIEGSGAALATLMRALDDAYSTWVAPRLAAGDEVGAIYDDLIAQGSSDPEFPYVASDGYGAASGPLAFRGPHGVQLVVELSANVGVSYWTTQLEVQDGAPILYMWAGQIAG